MLDKKDFEIIETLKQNARFSSQQISKKTKIPITTVHNRIKRMENEGVIKKYTAVLDNTKYGTPIAAYISIVVDYSLLKKLKLSQQELAMKLKLNPKVADCCMVTGASDIIIKVRFSDMDELNEFVTKKLRNIEGIEKTQTAVILDEL